MIHDLLILMFSNPPQIEIGKIIGENHLLTMFCSIFMRLPGDKHASHWLHEKESHKAYSYNARINSGRQ